MINATTIVIRMFHPHSVWFAHVKRSESESQIRILKILINRNYYTIPFNKLSRGIDLSLRSLAARPRPKDNNIVNVTVQHYYICENVGRRESRAKLMLSFCLRLRGSHSSRHSGLLVIDVAT